MVPGSKLYAFDSVINWTLIDKCLGVDEQECQDFDIEGWEYTKNLDDCTKSYPISVRDLVEIDKVVLYCIQFYSGEDRYLAFSIYDQYKNIYPDLEIIYSGKLYYVRRLKCTSKLELLKDYIDVVKVFANIIVRECDG